MSSDNTKPGGSSRSASQQKRQQQPSSPPPPSSSSASNPASNELLFLTYSNPLEFQNDRTSRRIVKKWASTTGLKHVRSHESQDESRQASPRSGESSRRSRSKSKTSRRPAVSPGLDSSRFPSPAEGNMDPTIVSASPDPSGQDARRMAYYQQNNEPHYNPLPQRPARPTPSQADQIRELLGSPNVMPDGASIDPFDGSSMPAMESELVGDIIQHYLDGNLLSHAWLQTEYDDVKNRLIAARRRVWFPMILQSRAAYCALLAFVEATPGFDAISESESMVQVHINLALRACTEELADSERQSSDATVLAVILLMITAHRMKDVNAFRTHARGLALLQSRRRIARSQKAPAIPFGPEHGWDTSDDAVVARGGMTGSSQPPSAAQMRSAVVRSLNGAIETDGFDSLVASQTLGEEVALFYHVSLMLIALSLRAGDDHFAGTAVVQHIFVETLEPPLQLQPVETASMYAIRLVLHAVARPIRDGEDKTADLCAQGAYQALHGGGLLALREANRPDAVVWIALTAGTSAKAGVRSWLGSVALHARAAAGCWTLAEAVTMLDEGFVWAAPLDGAARVFWAECVDADGAAPQGQNQTMSLPER